MRHGRAHRALPMRKRPANKEGPGSQPRQQSAAGGSASAVIVSYSPLRRRVKRKDLLTQA